jgi:hypothetical protein
MIMDKREDRRARTFWVCKRAWKIERERLHPQKSYINSAGDLCELTMPHTLLWYDKIGLQSHHCSKKSPGNPKVGHGVCRGFSVRPTALARSWKREQLAPMQRQPSAALEDADFVPRRF